MIPLEGENLAARVYAICTRVRSGSTGTIRAFGIEESVRPSGQLSGRALRRSRIRL